VRRELTPEPAPFCPVIRSVSIGSRIGGRQGVNNENLTGKWEKKYKGKFIDWTHRFVAIFATIDPTRNEEEGIG
jgi:hypothetical protein